VSLVENIVNKVSCPHCEGTGELVSPKEDNKLAEDLMFVLCYGIACKSESCDGCILQLSNENNREQFMELLNHIREVRK